MLVSLRKEAPQQTLRVRSSYQEMRLYCSKLHSPSIPGGQEFKKVSGGLLVQGSDLGKITANDLKVVTNKAPTPAQIEDMLFAWTVVKYVKSNAIIFCKDRMTIGVGAGQMSRVYSTRIAAIKAADEGLSVEGSVMASDAFFPFRDGIDAPADTSCQWSACRPPVSDFFPHC